MNVADCLREYETLGKRVFGHPRFFSQRKLAIIRRPRYRAEHLEEVFLDVTHRRSEKRDKRVGPVTFQNKPWELLCRT
jgi:hypothetical protein